MIDVEDCPVLTAKASRQLEVARQFLASEKTELNPEKNAEVFLDDSLDLSGADFLQPVGFRQANEEQNLFLKMTLGQYVRESGSSSVVELFAGTGNLTEQLSKEINSSGVTCVDLLTCAEGFKHKFPEIEFIGLDLYKGFSTLLDAAKKEKWSLLALDPPRAGWSDLAMFCEQVGTIERVAYISCNPNSFAKDAKALVDKGWKLESVLPVDMMPQTSQVELIAFLKREP